MHRLPPESSSLIKCSWKNRLLEVQGADVLVTEHDHVLGDTTRCAAVPSDMFKCLCISFPPSALSQALNKIMKECAGDKRGTTRENVRLLWKEVGELIA